MLRRLTAPLLAACVLLVLSGAVAAAQAGVDDERARPAEKAKKIGGKLELSVRDITPPEDVGSRPLIEITVKVAISKKKISRACLSGRGPVITIGPSGPGNPTGTRADLYPSSKKGKVRPAAIPLDYGGVSEGQVYSGHVDFAGGDLPIQARVEGRLDYAPVGGAFGTLIKCKALTSPLVTVPVAPALV